MLEFPLHPQTAALLCADFQKAPVRKATMFYDRGINENVQQVLTAARRAGMVVFHAAIDYEPAFFSPRNKFIQRIRIPVLSAPDADREELLEFVEEAEPLDSEPVIKKPRINPFFGTALESMLRSRDIDTLLVMGVATEFVVEAAARHAADADFRVLVLEDCCAAFSPEAHRAAIEVMDHIATIAAAETVIAQLQNGDTLAD